MYRKIIHLDLDAFFCAVEELRNPQLHGKPFAVGGRPEERGVVASCSYPARLMGIRSAMPMVQAIKLCNKLIIIPGDHRAYSRTSEQVMAHLHQVTPLLEQISIDEAFLDVTDLPGPVEEIARQIQRTIQVELSLPCSLGIATNKLVAKIANDVGKSRNRGLEPPNALTVVPPGEEAVFLAPLPVIALWGVGPKTAEQLESLGIHTIGDIARWPESDLVQRFGRLGHELSTRSQGIDDRPISTEHDVKSVSQEVTYVRDVSDPEILKSTLREFSDAVGLQLRKERLKGSTVKLKLRWSDFTTLSRQITLQQPTDTGTEIYQAAEQLFNKIWEIRRPVRLIGVGVSKLSNEVHQLSLWDSNSKQEQKLQDAFDQLREKYGAQVVQRGFHIKKQCGK